MMCRLSIAATTSVALIDSLPYEVLSKVFHLAATDRPRELRESLKPNPSIPSWLCVSKYWNHVVTTTPYVWSLIHHDVSKDVDTSTLLKFITLSRDVSLHISLRCEEPVLGSEEAAASISQKAQRACDLVRSQCLRIGSLFYTGTLHFLFPHMDPMPRLRRLQVYSSEPRVPLTTPPLSLLVADAPNVIAFGFGSVAFEDQVTDALACIDISLLEDINLGNLSSIYSSKLSQSNLHNLRKLRINVSQTRISKVTPIRFPSLNFLDYSGDFYKLSLIFESAPQLVHFAFRDFTDSGPADPVGVQWPSFPQLRTLSFNNHHAKHLIPLLPTVPYLHALEIDCAFGITSLLRTWRANSEITPSLTLVGLSTYYLYFHPAETLEDQLQQAPALLKVILTTRDKLTMNFYQSKLSTRAFDPERHVRMEEIDAIADAFPGRFNVRRQGMTKGEPPKESPKEPLSLKKRYPFEEVILELAQTSS